MYPNNRPGGYSTGPRTAAGKAVAAMNRLTHGRRSEKTILRHEDPTEYTSVIEGWFHQYKPHGPVERMLLDETAHAQWFLMRNQRRLDEVEYERNMNLRTWTDDQNREFARALGYKTAAKQSFFRWFKQLESFYARVRREQRRQLRAKPLENKPPEIQPTPAVVPLLNPLLLRT